MASSWSCLYLAPGVSAGRLIPIGGLEDSPDRDRAPGNELEGLFLFLEKCSSFKIILHSLVYLILLGWLSPVGDALPYRHLQVEQ